MMAFAQAQVAMTNAHATAHAYPSPTALAHAHPRGESGGESEGADNLKAMFPDIEAEVLSAVLAHHDGDIARAVSALLDFSAPPDEASLEVDQQEQDAKMARCIQQELDAEVARAVQASLEQELQAEAERARERQLPAVAAKTVSSATERAKAFLQRVRPGASASQQSTHAARLLDAPLDAATYDMSPLAATYAPPSITAAPTPTPTPPVAGGGSPLEPTTNPSRYSSRMDRARSANRNRMRTSPPAEAHATLAPLQVSALSAATAPGTPELV